MVSMQLLTFLVIGEFTVSGLKFPPRGTLALGNLFACRAAGTGSVKAGIDEPSTSAVFECGAMGVIPMKNGRSEAWASLMKVRAWAEIRSVE
jgi:hypothetical protein